MGRVVLEEGESITQALYRVVKVDINKNLRIELLVSPKDLQKGLESS